MFPSKYVCVPERNYIKIRKEKGKKKGKKRHRLLKSVSTRFSTIYPDSGVTAMVWKNIMLCNVSGINVHFFSCSGPSSE